METYSWLDLCIFGYSRKKGDCNRNINLLTEVCQTRTGSDNFDSSVEDCIYIGIFLRQSDFSLQFVSYSRELQWVKQKNNA